MQYFLWIIIYGRLIDIMANRMIYMLPFTKLFETINETRRVENCAVDAAKNVCNDVDLNEKYEDLSTTYNPKYLRR